jgi:hypothetical protein
MKGWKVFESFQECLNEVKMKQKGPLKKWRQDTQYNDIQHNDIQYNNI